MFRLGSKQVVFIFFFVGEKRKNGEGITNWLQSGSFKEFKRIAFVSKKKKHRNKNPTMQMVATHSSYGMFFLF
jgi:hypothetical protein